MKNTIAKSITAIVLTGLIASPAAMAAGKTDLVMQQFGTQHVSKTLVKQVQHKNEVSHQQLELRLDKKLNLSIDDINQRIDAQLAKQLSE